MANYEVQYKCRNCLHGYIVEVQKGKTAPEWINCPNCGVTSTVQKVSGFIHHDPRAYVFISQYQIALKE